MTHIKCPLCNNLNTYVYSRDKKREYQQCRNCSTVFVTDQYHLSIENEKKRYDLHTNSKDDNYYSDFLNRIVTPITSFVEKGSHGLDFGSGPGPILKDLFKPFNIKLSEYDLYYNNDKSLLDRNWDFIVTTEVIEHLKEPYKTIKALWDIIKTGGVLGVMTSLLTEDIDFNSWYYKGDPTHITFYSKNSFNWLAKELNATMFFFDKDITILIKN